MKELKVGTRGSKLALWQARWVENQLQSLGLAVRMEVIQTRGDREGDLSSTGEDAKELFVKEIEEALLERRIDLAVHSVKDLPSALPQGLVLAAVPTRDDPRDVLISKSRLSLPHLPAGAKLGTSSLRRQAQIAHRRPDLKFVPLRGNVDTRIRKLFSSDLDGIVLAAAGLKRLGLFSEATEFLEDEVCLSAPGQGAIGIESRGEESHLFRPLSDETTRTEVLAERAFLKRLQGGCRVPIAARARLTGSRLLLKGLICSPDGMVRVYSETEGQSSQAEEVGFMLAEEIIARGGDKVLAAGRN